VTWSFSLVAVATTAPARAVTEIVRSPPRTSVKGIVRVFVWVVWLISGWEIFLPNEWTQLWPANDSVTFHWYCVGVAGAGATFLRFAVTLMVGIVQSSPIGNCGPGGSKVSSTRGGVGGTRGVYRGPRSA